MDMAAKRCTSLAGTARLLCSESGVVTVSVRRYFGNNPISIPANELSYQDLRAPTPPETPEPWVVEHVRLLMLAHLHKGCRLRMPNLVLLFDQPVELPKVRLRGLLRLWGGDLTVLGIEPDGLLTGRSSKRST